MTRRANVTCWDVFVIILYRLLDWCRRAVVNLRLALQKPRKILIIGIYNSGKTTLLHMLKENRFQPVCPSLHPTMCEFSIFNTKIKAFDLGGRESARRLWQDYFTAVDGIVYVVDASDQDSFPENRKHSDALLVSPELETVPFLILGNKMDVPRAAGQDELKLALGLGITEDDSLAFGKYEGEGPAKTQNVRRHRRPLQLYMCSVVQKVGYSDGIQWLLQQIVSK